MAAFDPEVRHPPMPIVRERRLGVGGGVVPGRNRLSTFHPRRPRCAIRVLEGLGCSSTTRELLCIEVTPARLEDRNWYIAHWTPSPLRLSYASLIV